MHQQPYLKWQLIAVLWLFKHFSAATQTLENESIYFDQSNQLIRITYDLSGINFRSELNVRPYILADDSVDIQIKSLSGDFGWQKRSGKNKVIVWDNFKDGINSFEGVRIKLKTDIRAAETARFWGVALHGTNSAPFGLKMLRLSRVGFFASLRTGKLPPSYRYTITDAGKIDYLESGIYEILNKKRIASYAFTAGAIFQMAHKLYAYAGAGYGSEQLFWQYQSFNLSKLPTGKYWALNESINRKGTVLDAGVVIHSKRILVDFGLSTIQFKSFQIAAGLGYSFYNHKK